MEYTLERFGAETDIDSYLEGYVDFDTTLERCKNCSDYGAVWSCPPFDFDVTEFWKRFSKIRVSGYKICFPEERTREDMISVFWKITAMFSDELLEEEKKNPGSVSLVAGSCQRCAKCSRQEGAPCRLPGKMRHSIESLGGKVEKTVSTLCGVELEWMESGELPDHLTLAGALLIK